MLYTWVGVQTILQLYEDKIEDMVGINNTPREWIPIEKCETDSSRKTLVPWNSPAGESGQQKGALLANKDSWVKNISMGFLKRKHV